jgi:hypothetical protein
VSGPAKAELAARAGADLVVNYREVDAAAAVHGTSCCGTSGSPHSTPKPPSSRMTRHLAEAKAGADRGRPHAMPLLAGKRLRERYQDWDRGPFTGESQDHIWVCEVTAALAG